MSEKVMALGVFRIEVDKDDLMKFRDAWNEFLRRTGWSWDNPNGVVYLFFTSSPDSADQKLIDATIDALDKIDELEAAVEAESQFVEALMEDDEGW